MSTSNNNINQITPLFSVRRLQEYDDAGILTVPIPRGSKGPNKKEWNKRKNCGITLDKNALGWDENLGIAHAYSRTMAIDIDDLEKAREWFAARDIDLDDLLNAPDAVLIDSGRKNRAKLLYRLPEGVDPIPSKKVKNDDGFDIIDFRCATVGGRTVQDVLPPSIHPDTGKPYQWGGAGDFRHLPELPNDILKLWRGLLNGSGKSSDKDDGLFADSALKSATVTQGKVNATNNGLMGGAYSGPPASLEKAKSALEYVTPNTGYEPWCEILRGLHDWDDGVKGRETGREWSAKGDDYIGDAEFDAKWDSFNEENRPAGKKNTLGTVFDRATAGGWPGWGVTSGYSEGSGSSTDELNKQFAFVLLDGKDYILDVKRYTFSPVASIRNLLLNKFAHDENGTPIGKKTGGKIVPQSAFDVWMKSPQRRTYREIVFDPGQRHGEEQFNLYRGLSIEPIAGNCELILAHILNIWCRKDHTAFDYVMSWLARMVQMPWLQAQSIITLHSEEGTGKGLITDILAEFFKHHHLIATHQRDITGRFNDKLGTSIFVCINEAVWGGRKEEEGILKMLATDTTLTIEKKFVQKFSVPNCTHTIITSNSDWYAPLGRTDRRYLTLKVDNSIIGNYEYFDALRSEIDHGGRAAFLDYLLNYDISTFEPRAIPKVNDEERARLKNEGLNSMEKWIIDLVNEEALTSPKSDYYAGQLPAKIDSLIWETNPIEVPCRDLLDDYQSYAKARHYHIKSDTAVGLFLKKTLGVERFRLSTVSRPWAYILPKIADCRRKLTIMMGGSSPFSH